MEVSAGAVVDEEAGVVRHVDARVERGEERVVERVEDLCLGFRVGELLWGEEVLVDNLECETRAVVVAEAAEEDAAEVAGAEVAEEFKVAEVEAAVGGEVGCGLDGGPVGVGAAVGTAGDGGGRG